MADTDTKSTEDKRIAFCYYCEKCGVEQGQNGNSGKYCKEDGGQFCKCMPSACLYCWPKRRGFHCKINDHAGGPNAQCHDVFCFEGWIYSGDKHCRNCGRPVEEAKKGPPTLRPEKSTTTTPKRSFLSRLFGR